MRQIILADRKDQSVPAGWAAGNNRMPFTLSRAPRTGASFRNKRWVGVFVPQRPGMSLPLVLVFDMMECVMRSKLVIGTAALALTATLATAGSASAQRWHRWGWGPAGIAAGVVGGAVAAATSPFWAPGYGYYDGYNRGYSYGPGYAYGDSYDDPGYSYAPAPSYRYGQSYAMGGRDDAYCAQRYRSYDPASGTYLGYDGIRHACP